MYLIKNLLLPMFALIMLTSFSKSNNNELGEKINWITWEEAIEANKKAPKKIMIDLYTDWCHWCKVMDKKTFSDKAVIKYVNENFYAVKLDGEYKKDIQFSGNVFKYVPNGRRGYHELAAALVDGKMSYPSMVYMNENIQRILISPGYKEKADFITELKYVSGEHYLEEQFEVFKRKNLNP